ncbi:SRPBCC family protein [Ktedonosporobacter rubrisoli]|nr:SRPBCC family protein [Ktedonosporobacter rubrisoli]
MTLLQTSGTTRQNLAAMQTPAVRTLSTINVGKIERRLSLLGGGLFVALGLARRGWSGAALTMLGAGGIYRGATGHSFTYQALGISTASTIPIQAASERVVTIQRSPAELYRFWSEVANWPAFMRQVQTVKKIGDNHLHFVAKASFNTHYEWDGEITAMQENCLIAWREMKKPGIINTYSVHFTPAPAGRGTEVSVREEYYLPVTPAGASSMLLGRLFLGARIMDDLRRCKALLEASEIPTTEGQASGRRKE